jgi:hypothetical protein
MFFLIIYTVNKTNIQGQGLASLPLFLIRGKKSLGTALQEVN